MSDIYTQIPLTGILLILVLREVLPFINHKNNWKDRFETSRHEELRELLKSVNENISAQTKILVELCNDVRSLKQRIED